MFSYLDVYGYTKGTKKKRTVRAQLLLVLCCVCVERQLTLRVIVERPPGDVDFGIQEGHGNDYKTVQKQRYTKEDLRFEFPIRVREGKNGRPKFLGSFAQGPANNRFIYLDIGTYAGQTNTPWGHRLKTSRLRFVFSVQPLCTCLGFVDK